MNEELDDNSMIDTELQVRLMNLVMGEASDFERDQLQLLMEQRAELAAYYQHLEHLHGLLCNVGSGDTPLDVEQSLTEDTWQLPSNKREQLLAVLDGKVHSAPGAVSLASDMKFSVRSRRSRMMLMATIATAACVLMALTFNSFLERAELASPKLSVKSSIAKVAANSSSMDSDQDKGLALARALESNAATNDSRVTLWDATTGRAEGVKEYALSDGKGVGAADADVNAYRRRVDARVETGKPDSRGYFGVDRQVAEVATNRGGDGNSPTAAGNSAEPEAVAFSNTGTTLLGGTERFADDYALLLSESENRAKSDRESQLSRTVTPRIVIPEAEEQVQRFAKADDGPVKKYLAEQLPTAENELSQAQTADNKKVSSGQTAEGRKETEGLAVPSFGTTPANVAIGAQINGDMLGDVQTEFIEDLDLVIIKGAKRDVERTLEVIDGLKQPQSFTEKDEKRAGAELPSLAKANEKQKSSLVVGDFATSHYVNPALIVPSDAQSQSSSISSASPLADRGWRYIAPPRPQVASKERGRVAVEGKAAEPKQTEAIDEQSAATQAFSTFSLHVSDVSFKLAQAALAQGQWPEATKIRIEEFVNALDYHDPLPAESEKVSCRVDQAIHPFLMQRNLLRISMRTAATGRAQNTPLRLTIVLDNSGSMERADRRQAVVQAMQMLTKQLRPADQVTLISFANTPRLLAEKVVGDQGASLVKLIENLPSEGGTNIEAALSLAREKALEQQLAGAQNRIVLLTDGAVNLGNANPESLAKLVTQLRDAGIAFDAAGIGATDLNDEVLEALTRQGDGRYYLLDSADAVAESFAAQMAGALRPSAQNVKVQVEFNPQRVGRYKLLGFEKHRLKQEDFRNDKVDAAEMAAAEAGVAVYHYEIKPNGSGDVGSVSVRFRDLSSGQMIERRWPIPYDSGTPRLEQAEPTMQLAATAALFAAKLSGGPLADSVDLTQLQKLLANISEQYANQPRVVQLRTMIEQAKAMQK